MYCRFGKISCGMNFNVGSKLHTQDYRLCSDIFDDTLTPCTETCKWHHWVLLMKLFFIFISEFGDSRSHGSNLASCSLRLNQILTNQKPAFPNSGLLDFFFISITSSHKPHRSQFWLPNLFSTFWIHKNMPKKNEVPKINQLPLNYTLVLQTLLSHQREIYMCEKISQNLKKSNTIQRFGNPQKICGPLFLNPL